MLKRPSKQTFHWPKAVAIVEGLSVVIAVAMNIKEGMKRLNVLNWIK